MELFGIRLVGFNTATGHKVLLTIGLLLVLWLIRSAVLALLGRVDASGDRASRIGFWARQGVSLPIAALAMIGFVSIWFDDPANLTTAVGLVTAGLAFALQKVVTSLAGYTTGSRSRCVSAHDHGVRRIKDALSRDVLARLEEAGIGIASATFEITRLPEVKPSFGA